MKLKLLVAVAFLSSACGLVDNQASKKPDPTGLIATPASYYSTAKAKYLAARYKDNLDRIVERIVRTPKTSGLQFANNISSVGGIGFFTHSATKTPDERYLEVVLATPETFESKIDVSAKVQQLFSRYGAELLGILSGDADIYRDKELSGYGLNLAWRNVVGEASGNRIALARTIVYFQKERVLSFLRNEINQNELLSDAVIFAVDEGGPLNLVSYKPQTLRPELRPTIREDDLTSSPVAATQSPMQPAAPVKTGPQKIGEKQKTGQSTEMAKDETSLSTPTAKASQQENKGEVKKAIAGAQSVAKPAKGNGANETPQKATLAQPKAKEQVVSTSDIKGGSAREASIDELKAEAKSDAAKTDATAPPSTVAPAAKRPDQNETATPASSSDSNVAGVKIQESTSRTTPVSVPQLVGEAPAAPEPVAEPSKIAPIVVADTPRVPAVLSKTETKSRGEPGQNVVAKPAATQPVVEQKAKERKIAPATSTPMSRPEPSIEVSQAQSGNTPPVKGSDTTKTSPSIEKSLEQKQEVKSTLIASTKPAAPTERTHQQEPAKLRDEKKVAASQPGESGAVEEGKNRQANAETKTRDATPQFSPALDESPIAKAQTPSATRAAPSIAKTETPPVETKPVVPPVVTKSSVSEKSKNEQVALLNKSNETIAQKTAPAKPIVQTPVELVRPMPTAELPKATPAPSIAPPVEVKAGVPAAAAKEEEMTAQKPAREQVALLSKPMEPAIERKSALMPRAQKALEGFIIQIAFSDKEKARHWAEAMQRRGYAVSLTEAGVDGALRVRLGNFAAREDAERQLHGFKQDGLTGIIINLPQAYRPEARSSVP